MSSTFWLVVYFLSGFGVGVGVMIFLYRSHFLGHQDKAKVEIEAPRVGFKINALAGSESISKEELYRGISEDIDSDDSHSKGNEGEGGKEYA